MTTAVRLTDDIPFVLCVGTGLEYSAAIARVVQNDAVVLVATDTESARALLGAGDPSQVRDHHLIARGELFLDLDTREARWRGAEIRLSAREFDILATLATDPGRVWTFEDLTRQVWRSEYFGDSDAVVSAVKRLRRRLATVADLRVVSVRAVGYRLLLPD